MENLSRVFQKQKRKKGHEEIEFYNSILDRVFATVYRLKKSVWKNKMPVCYSLFPLSFVYNILISKSLNLNKENLAYLVKWFDSISWC